MECGVGGAIIDRKLEFSSPRVLRKLSWPPACPGEEVLPLFLPSSCGQTHCLDRLAQWLQGFVTTGVLPIAVAPPPKQRILSLRQGSQAMVVCFFLLGDEGEAKKDCGVLSLMESIHTSNHLFQDGS